VWCWRQLPLASARGQLTGCLPRGLDLVSRQAGSALVYLRWLALSEASRLAHEARVLISREDGRRGSSRASSAILTGLYGWEFAVPGAVPRRGLGGSAQKLIVLGMHLVREAATEWPWALESESDVRDSACHFVERFWV
jgi:predicted small integral membrane protein